MARSFFLVLLLLHVWQPCHRHHGTNADTTFWVSSPKFYAQQFYDANQHFEYVKELLDAQPTTCLEFKLSEIDIEDSCLCTKDYLAVYDGAKTQSLLMKTCGQPVRMPEVRTSGPAIRIVFHSSSEVAKGRGFLASLTVRENCEPLMTSFANYPVPLNAFYGRREENNADEDDELQLLRISGGIEAKPHSYPWHAVISEKSPSPDVTTRYCGGVLISKRHVLTAAHCLRVVKKPAEWDVIFGQHASRKCDGYSRQALTPEAIVVHPNYNKLSPKDSDIALIVLPEPGVKFTKFVRPVRLPKTQTAPGTVCSVAGIGVINKDDKRPHCLMEAKLPVLEMELCRGESGHNFSQVPLTNNMLCVYSELASTCQGDSGGGLVCREKSDHSSWYLAGLVSFGHEECGKRGIATVFSRVFNFVDWIYQQIPYLRTASDHK